MVSDFPDLLGDGLCHRLDRCGEQIRLQHRAFHRRRKLALAGLVDFEANSDQKFANRIRQWSVPFLLVRPRGLPRPRAPDRTRAQAVSSSPRGCRSSFARVLSAAEIIAIRKI